MAIHCSFPRTSHLVFFLAFFTVRSVSAINPSEPATRMCNRSSDFNFCVNTLYSDLPTETPVPDRYTLAFTIVRIAWRNADNTLDYLTNLLNHTSNSSRVYQPLHDCKLNYQKAVDSASLGLSDIDTDNYEYLTEYAGDASRAVDRCQAALRGIQTPPITETNQYFKALCQVWLAVGKDFCCS